VLAQPDGPIVKVGNDLLRGAAAAAACKRVSGFRDAFIP